MAGGHILWMTHPHTSSLPLPPPLPSFALPAIPQSPLPCTGACHGKTSRCICTCTAWRQKTRGGIAMFRPRQPFKGSHYSEASCWHRTERLAVENKTQHKRTAKACNGGKPCRMIRPLDKSPHRQNESEKEGPQAPTGSAVSRQSSLPKHPSHTPTAVQQKALKSTWTSSPDLLCLRP